MTNRPTHIIVHHQAFATESNQFDAINRYHKKKFDFISSIGFYGSYHWLVERDGTTKRYRADEDEGAHTLNGWNKKSIGVCLAGDFNTQAPSEAQIASLRALIKEYDLPYLLHREAHTTRTCPGRNFSRDTIDIVIQDDAIDMEKCAALTEENNTLKVFVKFLINLIKQLSKNG